MNLAPPRARLVTRADLGAALVLLALTVLLFFPAATLQGVVFYGDAANYLPRLAFNTRALLAGRLPEWNPYLAGGYPHIADPGAMTFYPLQYPFFVLLPTFAAFNYYLLFHYILAGVGMYGFGRMLGIGAGDEVLVPSYSFIASANSILHAGATPVFIDIDARTYNTDADLLAEKITPRTRAMRIGLNGARG